MSAVPPSLIKACVNDAMAEHPAAVDGVIKAADVLKGDTADRLRTRALRLVIKRSGLSKKRAASSERAICRAIDEEFRSRIHVANAGPFVGTGTGAQPTPEMREAIMSHGGEALRSAEATRPVLEMAAATNELATLKVSEDAALARLGETNIAAPLLHYGSLLGQRDRLTENFDAEMAGHREKTRSCIGEMLTMYRARDYRGALPDTARHMASMVGLGKQEAVGEEWFNSIDWQAHADKTGVDVELLRSLGRALAEVPNAQRIEAVELAEKHWHAQARKRGELEDGAGKVLAALPPWKPGVAVVVAGLENSAHDKLVAYRTELAPPIFAKTLRGLVESWDAGTRRQVFEDEWPNLPGQEELQAALETAKQHVPEGVGLAIIAGHGDAAQYISNVDRKDMREVLLEIAGKLGAPAEAPKKSMSELAMQVLRDWHCPPGEIRTAQHREVFAMNLAHAWALLGGLDHEPDTDRQKEWADAMMAAGTDSPRFGELLDRIVKVFFGDVDNPSQGIQAFLDQWQQSAFARLEIGHKLAAALCLTDVPDDIEVRAPWPAWSLVLPDGLLGEGIAEDGHALTPARLWCLGTEPKFAVSTKGTLTPWQSPPTDRARPTWLAVKNLIKGACLALSNPEEFRKETQRGGGSKASKSKRSGPPELEQVRYMLSAPVQIDFREHLQGVLSGRKGGKQTVQSLVRGHWRNQAYGPKHSLRRSQWIEPFWRGPEESRVLLRAHSIREKE